MNMERWNGIFLSFGTRARWNFYSDARLLVSQGGASFWGCSVTFMLSWFCQAWLWTRAESLWYLQVKTKSLMPDGFEYSSLLVLGPGVPLAISYSILWFHMCTSSCTASLIQVFIRSKLNRTFHMLCWRFI